MGLPKNTHKGQTLIEILITLVIVGIGILALVRLQSVLLYQDNLAQQDSEAVLLGTKKIESLRDYTVLATTTGKKAYQDIISGSETASSNNATYTLSWAVTNASDDTYKTVDLTISWVDKQGQTQSKRLTTHIAKIDPVLSVTIMQ